MAGRRRHTPVLEFDVGVLDNLDSAMLVGIHELRVNEERSKE